MQYHFEVFTITFVNFILLTLCRSQVDNTDNFILELWVTVYTSVLIMLIKIKLHS